MEKFIELLTVLGFKKEVIEKIKSGEEVDLNAEAESFLTEKDSLSKSDEKFINGIKASAKKEGEIVARKQFKRLLNKEFGLALTETPLNEISDEDIIKKAKETGTGAANADLEKLQQQVITLTNEKTALENEKTAEVEKVKLEYAGKLKQTALDKKLADYVDTLTDEAKGGKGLIVSKTTAIKNLKLGIQEAGITDFEFDEEGNITKLLKGDLPAVQPGNKGFETLETIGERSLGEFIKKSNGTGGESGESGSGSSGASDGSTDEIPEEVKSHLAKMKQSAGMN